jgi:hypothetical protein
LRRLLQVHTCAKRVILRLILVAVRQHLSSGDDIEQFNKQRSVSGGKGRGARGDTGCAQRCWVR